jgi:hypothetical protein
MDRRFDRLSYNIKIIIIIIILFNVFFVPRFKKIQFYPLLLMIYLFYLTLN